MHTTSGDLELELWATQCPLTCRNFLQLCLDGYYENTIFHRLVPGFIVQGGDPTGTGHGGEAIYPGGLFADEFHSRLKFNRRGLLGMANSGKPDDNGSQFFFTLGDTKELTGKNTMFGKVVGDTIYNLVKIGDMELEEEGSEKMLYPVKITGAEVLVNPFEDMMRREPTRKEVEKEVAKKVPAGKKKGVGKKGKALLSFGGDEEEAEPVMPVKKMKFDTRLVSAIPEEEEKEKAALIKSRPTNTESSSKARKSPSNSPSSSRSPSPAPRQPQPPAARKPTKSTPIPIPSRSPSPAPAKHTDSYLAKTNAQIEALKSSLKRSGTDTPSSSAPPPKKKSLLALQKEMLPSTSIKGRKRKRNGTGKGAAGEMDDGEAMDALERFKRKLAKAAEERDNNEQGDDTITMPISEKPVEADAPTATAPVAPTGEGEEEEEYQLCDLHFIPHCQSCKSWDEAHAKDANPSGAAANEDDADTGDFLGHVLKFEKDRLGKDLKWKKDHEYDDGLVVIDPREKGRELADHRGRGRGGRGGRTGDAGGSGSGSGGGRGGGGGAGGGEWDRGKDGDWRGRGGRGGRGDRGGRGGMRGR